MHSDMASSFDRVYSPAEIGKKLEIKTVTVRKYAAALESCNYSITRNEKGHRIFLEKDYVALSELQNLVQKMNISVEKAAKLVAARIQQAHYDHVAITAMGSKDLHSSKYESVAEQLALLNHLPHITEQLQELRREYEVMKNQMLVWEQTGTQIIGLLHKENGKIKGKWRTIIRKLFN